MLFSRLIGGQDLRCKELMFPSHFRAKSALPNLASHRPGIILFICAIVMYHPHPHHHINIFRFPSSLLLHVSLSMVSVGKRCSSKILLSSKIMIVPELDSWFVPNVGTHDFWLDLFTFVHDLNLSSISVVCAVPSKESRKECRTRPPLRGLRRGGARPM